MTEKLDGKTKFTDTRLLALSPPETGRAYYTDTTQPGLRLQITSTGTITFQCRAWSSEHKRPITRTLGRYPTLPIATARKLAAEALARIQRGADLGQERRDKQAEQTLNAAFRRHMNEYAAAHNREKYRITTEGIYRQHVQPALGSKKVSEISPAMIEAWHRGLLAKKRLRGEGTISKATANRALAAIRSLYNHTLPSLPNPAAGCKQFRETSRARFLQPAELKAFFAAVAEEPNHDMAEYFMLSILTGARRANVLGMRWADLDFNLALWTVPADESKNHEHLQIPLMPEAVAILQERKRRAASIFVFPSHGKTGHLQEPKRGWQRICKHAGLKDVRIHDLRRTMGSYMTIGGASTAITGKALGHKSQQATAIYTRLNLDPVRSSMETAVGLMLATSKLPEEEKIILMGASKK